LSPSSDADLPAPPLAPDGDVERLRFALEAARLGDWSWDAGADAVSFSPRAAEIFGAPPGAVLSREALYALLHPDDRVPTRLAVERALRERGDYAIECRLTNGGRERWVSVSGRGRYDERGEVLGMLGVAQDVTAGRVLVRLDDAVRPLVAPEDITFTAARVLGQHLGVNRCAYAFVEGDEDTFLLTGNYTDGTHSIVGRYRFRQFGAECLRLMRAGEPYVVEDSEGDPRVDADDREAYRLTAIRSVVCVPILKSGRFVAAMAVHALSPRAWTPAEVTLVQQVASRCWESIERARVEREREALLEAAEAANRAKDEFFAMLGHELRNPLAPIVTAVHLMKLRGDQPSPRERAVIERQVSHLTRLVDDLLDVSRIARGKVELKRELVDLAEIVTRAVEQASPLLERRAHVLSLDLPRGLAALGDAERLTQVVTNLLTNAGKYTPPGGHVAVSLSAEGDEVVLRVRDDGVGMPADVLEHAFDLFVQGRQSIDRAQGGLGLGLAIVRSLVERHGGGVSAHSEGPDRGSEFVVRLPRAGAPDAGEAPPAAPDGPRPAAELHARVLVVDDNVDAAETLGHVLDLQGCEVQVVHDGPSALRLAAARAFDAALLDIGLPVMDGYELAARLRELPGTAGARLVAVTGYGQDSDRERTAAAGFHHHLVKPVNPESLAAILQGLPPRRRAG
jgi:PAS domain S-box-containing protein